MPPHLARAPIASMAITKIPAANVRYDLQPDMVHVWRIPVVANAAAAIDFSHWLTSTEQVRASRFTRDEDRLRFQSGRAATRRILARYLGLPAAQVRIDPDTSGKPTLSSSTVSLARMIQFNLSHSGSWIVAAFARSFPVGIDVESVKADGAGEDLIAYFMSDSERRSLQALPRQRQTAAFFKCWTSKEAFVKGLGLGLAIPLKAIEVCLDPDQPARLISAPPEYCPGDWRLHTIEVSQDYAATLAVAAPTAAIVDIALSDWREISSE
jgi:4'-phosphopantetheinyl transferase